MTRQHLCNWLWSGARSAVSGVATRDYFGTLDRRPDLQHAISQRLIIHCQLVVQLWHASRERTPPACQIRPALQLYAAISSSCFAKCHRCTDRHYEACWPIDAALDFKTKTILQPMFTLAFSQAAQRLVSKLTPCVIAAPIKRAMPQLVRFWDLNSVVDIERKTYRGNNICLMTMGIDLRDFIKFHHN